MQKAVLILLLAFVAVRASYAPGHKVLGVIPTTENNVRLLRELHTSKDIVVDFWNDPRKPFVPVYIHVDPKNFISAKKWFETHKMPYFVRHSDLQKAINDFMDPIRKRQQEKRGTKEIKDSSDFVYTVYHTEAEINAQFLAWNTDYPSETSYESMGQTVEGREQYVFKVEDKAQPNKPIIFIEDGIHAREWIGPAVGLYFVNYLLTNTDATTIQLRNKYNWHIAVNLNADGYAYTWLDPSEVTGTDPRMWRKNRKDNGNACFGVDLNRNYDSDWGGSGSSDVTCSETYCGASPNSEPETKNLINYITKYNTQVANGLYFSIHSYSQLMMYPYGYRAQPPANSAELDNGAAAFCTALQAVYGTRYNYGPIYTTIYPAAGGSIDYVYDSLGVTRIWTAELRDTGRYGFLLPEDQIQPCAEETWAGWTALVNTFA